MDSDPGLRRRFSLVLDLDDYSPDDLAHICESAAKNKFKLTFSDGLRPLLAQHIAKVHGHEIKQHNGGLAVTLVERAFRRLAMRIGMHDGGSGAPDSSVLVPEDFEINVSEVATVPAKRAAMPESARSQRAPQG